MPEDVKKIILLYFHFQRPAEFYQLAQDKNFPGLGWLASEGTWATKFTSSATIASSFASLLTGASDETHGVQRIGDVCRAEYLWEAAQRSSKRTILFGTKVDRPPALRGPAELVTASDISSHLKTNPDWDISLVQLNGKSSNQEMDKQLNEFLRATDLETLLVWLAIAEGGSGGSLAIAGPGVRKAQLLQRSIKVEDVVPTLCYLAELSVPADCEGGILYQCLKDPDMKMKEMKACRRNYERLKRSTGPSAMC